MTENRRVVLVRRPEGRLSEADFAIERAEIPPTAPGQVLVEVSHISIDAFIRTTLDATGFHNRSGIGQPVTALGVGRVVESEYEPLLPGDWVVGPTMAQSLATMPGQLFTKIDTSVVSPSTYLGLLGMTTGLTAYAGMHLVARVQPGDAVVVSAAAGAVGSVACQLAKIAGATVVGIAGGPEKAKWLTGTIGIDAAIDYRNEDVGARLGELLPGGIDVFFDNVGGEILDLALDRLRVGARVCICGAISQYEHMEDVRGPRLYLRLAERNATMAGFTVDHYASEFGRAAADIIRWMGEGQLILPEQIERGIERFPAALMMLFNGGHMGKLLVAP